MEKHKKIRLELDLPAEVEPKVAQWVGSMALKGINDKLGHLGIYATIIEEEPGGEEQ